MNEEKKISTTCTNCGADLTIGDVENCLICEYCGNKVMLNDKNEKQLYNNMANAKRVENNKKVKLELIELEKKKEQEKMKKKALIKRAIIVFVLLSIFFRVFGVVVGILLIAAVVSIILVKMVHDDSKKHKSS